MSFVSLRRNKHTRTPHPPKILFSLKFSIWAFIPWREIRDRIPWIGVNTLGQRIFIVGARANGVTNREACFGSQCIAQDFLKLCLPFGSHLSVAKK